jgi:ribulose-phosphate 3-epimerase
MTNPLIAPSILAADFSRLNEALVAIDDAGADWVHIDVMDGHFVPNLTFGPPVIKAIRNSTKLPFDVHLMIEKPELSIEQYAKAGADRITVHAEACPHLHRTLSQITECGVKSGVALNPSTPASAIDHVLHLTDMVLVMTVNPGFGGQAFIESQLAKIEAVRQRIDAVGRDIDLEVDGGINADTARRARRAGADLLVAGTATFTGGASAYADNIARLRGSD